MDNPNKASMSSVVSIAQILLRKEQDKGNEITPLLIARKLDTAALTDPDADFDKAAAIEELVRRFSHWVGKESTLKSTFDHLDWLDSERKKDWRYWGRLQRYLNRVFPSMSSRHLITQPTAFWSFLKIPGAPGVGIGAVSSSDMCSRARQAVTPR